MVDTYIHTEQACKKREWKLSRISECSEGSVKCEITKIIVTIVKIMMAQPCLNDSYAKEADASA